MRGIFLVAALLLALPAVAQSNLQERLKVVRGDPAASKAAVEAGRKASFFCANCHGETGISKSPEIPNLAGQNPAYLLEQIRKFGSGERKDPFMQGLIKVLKDDERIQIALFYAGSPVRTGAADASLAARGKVLFGKLCVRCHGQDAHGGELFPRLAGQNAAYLETSVARYRDGTGIRNDSLMSIATATLKNDDIKALTSYLTQLP